LKLKEIEEEDVVLSQKLDALFGGSSEHQAFVENIIRSVSHDPSTQLTIWAMIRSVLQTWFMLITFRLRIPRGVSIKRAQVGAFLELLHDKIRLKRNVSFLSLSQRLMIVWRWVHLPFAYLLLTITIGHIVYNLLLNPKL
jgi:hypothetical protein